MKKTITNAMLALILMFMMTGCGSMGATSAIGVGALGALGGQIIGKSTEATLIGWGVGTGLGYIFGNEWDKYQMRNTYIPQQPMYPPPQQYQQPPPQYQQQYYDPRTRRGY